MKTVSITLEISEQTIDLLRALGSPEEVIQSLASHAADGVRRPGAWERGWVNQCFGYDFEKNIEVDPICKGQHWTNFRTKGTKGQEK